MTEQSIEQSARTSESGSPLTTIIGMFALTVPRELSEFLHGLAEFESGAIGIINGQLFTEVNGRAEIQLPPGTDTGQLSLRIGRCSEVLDLSGRWNTPVDAQTRVSPLSPWCGFSNPEWGYPLDQIPEQYRLKCSELAILRFGERQFVPAWVLHLQLEQDEIDTFQAVRVNLRDLWKEMHPRAIWEIAACEWY